MVDATDETYAKVMTLFAPYTTTIVWSIHRSNRWRELQFNAVMVVMVTADVERLA